MNRSLDDQAMRATMAVHRTMRPLRKMVALAVAMSLTACTVGPDYVRPATPVPERFARTDASAGPSTALPADAAPAPLLEADTGFWDRFGDPMLPGLIADALGANHDVAIAVSRYDTAQALLANAGFDRFPTMTATGQTGRQLRSKDQAFGAPRDARDTPISSAAIQASWEVDVFGRVRRGLEAQHADTAASVADLRAVRVAVAGALAQAYVDLRAAHQRLRSARANVDTQRETLALIEARGAAGRGSDLESARARAQLETTISRIAGSQAAIGVNEHRLAVLSGKPPGAWIGRFDTLAPLPMLTGAVDPGTPGDLLRRRPDVAAAEARLHAATARIGVATADLFPRFTLSGLIGGASNSYGVFGSGSDTRLVALGVDWSFLNVGRVKARIAASDAAAAGDLARYQQTVLLALEDTENAVLRVSRSQEESHHLRRAVDDSTRASRIATQRFTAGAIDYFQVLDAERAKLAADDAAIDADLRAATAAISLYKAMAGGWPEASETQSSATSNPGNSTSVNPNFPKSLIRDGYKRPIR